MWTQEARTASLEARSGGQAQAPTSMGRQATASSGTAYTTGGQAAPAGGQGAARSDAIQGQLAQAGARSRGSWSSAKGSHSQNAIYRAAGDAAAAHQSGVRAIAYFPSPGSNYSTPSVPNNSAWGYGANAGTWR